MSTNIPSTLAIIRNEAEELFFELAKVADAIAKKIPRLSADQSETNEGRRLGIARKNLHESGLLTSQIMKALDQGSVLLSLIGGRTLLENYINTKFTFDHPDHLGDKAWIYKICNDYYKSGNDPEAPKSQLGGVSVYRRAKQVGEKDLYKKSYAGLCNFSHPKIHGALTFNNGPMKDGLACDLYVHIITLFLDTLIIIQEHFEAPRDEELYKRIESFSNRFPTQAP